MKIILVVMLELATLYFFAPNASASAERLTASSAIRAECELYNAREAYERTSEQSVDYDQVIAQYKNAATRAFRAEGEYKEYLLRRIHSL